MDIDRTCLLEAAWGLRLEVVRLPLFLLKTLNPHFCSHPLLLLAVSHCGTRGKIQMASCPRFRLAHRGLHLPGLSHFLLDLVLSTPASVGKSLLYWGLGLSRAKQHPISW